SGGPDMRGFNSQRLSPLAVVERRGYVPHDGLIAPAGPTIPPPGPYNGQTVPGGGNGLLNGPPEARYNVLGPLIVATFVDTGFVTEGSLDLGRPGAFAHNIFYAFGVGVRYRTPVGPLRVDVAYRPNIGPPFPLYDGG